MWEEILKRSGALKKLNYKFLKEIVLAKGKEMKGEVLSADEYLQLQEEIRKIYTKKHRGLPLDRIKIVITKILKANNLLEVKSKRKNIFDDKGNRLGQKEVSDYHFI